MRFLGCDTARHVATKTEGPVVSIGRYFGRALGGGWSKSPCTPRGHRRAGYSHLGGKWYATFAAWSRGLTGGIVRVGNI